MILVVGATGLLGRDICRRLGAAGKPVRALVRRTADRAKVDELERSGATLVRGDLKDRASLEVVRAFEQAGGRPFTVEHVPEEALRAQRTAATDPLQQSFAALMLAYALGNSIDMRSTLKTFPVPLVSVKEYARRITQARG